MCQQSYALVIISDEIAEKIVMEQYSYSVYSDYDILLDVDNNNGNDISLDCEEKRALVFLHDRNEDALCLKETLDRHANIHFVIFLRKGVREQIPIVFSVSKELSYKYVEYLMDDFPQIILSESDKDLFVETSGYSLFNIYHLMQICYYNHITIRQINKDILTENDAAVETEEKLVDILGLSAIGIHRRLAEYILSRDKLSYYLRKQYVFHNAGYIIPNVCLQLQYCDDSRIHLLELWNYFDCYIRDLKNNDDWTIVAQTICILQKTLRCQDKYGDELGDIIFRIEGKLHKLFRFVCNAKLLELDILCKQYFENDKIKSAYLMVNEAILYEDIEKYDVAKQKFELILELSSKIDNMEIYVYVMDEFSRLLEKTCQYKEALKRLYFVEKYYLDKDNMSKLRNVRNRIGINLSFTGNIKAATECLEKIHFGDFDGKINSDNVLSCEVANNLSICYMESGDYEEALKLQDELYRVYKIVEDAPVNYATDILQNKGNVYLFQHNYREATSCFEIALNDEKNPVSRELILENYIYAKALWKKDFSEAISFFEDQIEQKEDNETRKMLAELYYAGGFFKECFLFCKKVLNEITYEQNEILFIAIDVLFIKSSLILKKLSLFHRGKAILRLYKYQKFIMENIGSKSPYCEEVLTGKEMALGFPHE